MFGLFRKKPPAADAPSPPAPPADDGVLRVASVLADMLGLALAERLGRERALAIERLDDPLVSGSGDRFGSLQVSFVAEGGVEGTADFYETSVALVLPGEAGCIIPTVNALAYRQQVPQYGAAIGQVLSASARGRAAVVQALNAPVDWRPNAWGR